MPLASFKDSVVGEYKLVLFHNAKMRHTLAAQRAAAARTDNRNHQMEREEQSAMYLTFQLTNKNMFHSYPLSLNIEIRWIVVPADVTAFAAFLSSEQGRNVTAGDLRDWESAGTSYCGLFVRDEMFARTAVERYSETAWECADVRVARSARGCGYAKQICSFVTSYILGNEKTATIGTESDNTEMLKVIGALGYSGQNLPHG
jgi:hypothetical protein